MKVHILLVILCNFSQLFSATWQNTEIHYQVGKLDNPFSKTQTKTEIITLQHASGWKYGDNFFFVDFIDDGNNDGFGDSDVHGEVYINFSSKKVLGYGDKFFVSPLQDIGLTLGYDFTADVNSKKLIPGIRLDWNVPRFTFLNTLIGLYSDHSGGVASGGAPTEDDSIIVDLSYKRPFHINSQSFSVEGHLEWIGDRDTETGGKNSWWVLSQMQLRYDIGKAVLKKNDKLFVGIEWQYWKNKLGVRNEDENAVQFLSVWSF